MKVLSIITSNPVLNIGVLSWFLAQLIKFILTMITTKKVNFERLVGTGGMPSSHSAFTVSIAVAIARIKGFSSVEFAMAFAFAVVVMTDAMGVRRAAGEQAKALNQMIFEFSDFPWFLKKGGSVDIEVPLEEEPTNNEESKQPITAKELKEVLGHTPLEVVGGGILGIIIALMMPTS